MLLNLLDAFNWRQSLLNLLNLLNTSEEDHQLHSLSSLSLSVSKLFSLSSWWWIKVKSERCTRRNCTGATLRQEIHLVVDDYYHRHHHCRQLQLCSWNILSFPMKVALKSFHIIITTIEYLCNGLQDLLWLRLRILDSGKSFVQTQYLCKGWLITHILQFFLGVLQM